jgi:hypothetical protein
MNFCLLELIGKILLNLRNFIFNINIIVLIMCGLLSILHTVFAFTNITSIYLKKNLPNTIFNINFFK